jgi:hypothetical protein
MCTRQWASFSRTLVRPFARRDWSHVFTHSAIDAEGGRGEGAGPLPGGGRPKSSRVSRAAFAFSAREAIRSLARSSACGERGDEGHVIRGRYPGSAARLILPT